MSENSQLFIVNHDMIDLSHKPDVKYFHQRLAHSRGVISEKSEGPCVSLGKGTEKND